MHPDGRRARKVHADVRTSSNRIATDMAAPKIATLALGLTAATSTWAGGVPGVDPDAVVETIEVSGQRVLKEQPRSSTEGYVTAEQLAERPISRAGELLEFVPGLMVTQHSGEGKANQYFLRGFNLDHGTDFYTEVDGMPVNMRTHAHGQGYADINFVIPELIGSLEYRKGPYYADVGDFAAAGSASLRYVDSLPSSIATITAGEFGYVSGLVAGSPKVGDGTLLLGATATHYDGPFDLDEDVRKVAGVARYNVGDDAQGYTLSLAGYGIEYAAPDQIPQRAVDDGTIGPKGFIDPTDGGDVGRYSANAEWRSLADGGTGAWRAQAYALKYRMQLYSNFTYFLSDPDDGDALPDDQFNQFDDRWVYGLNLRRTWKLSTRIPTEIEAGVQGRYDDIETVALKLTQQRRATDGGIDGDGVVRSDSVNESSAGVYVAITQQWLPWFRSQLGLRGDGYWFDVDSSLDANSGKADDHITSPKIALIFGPFDRTLLFANYGEGFHSNDARGTTIRIDPTDGLSPADRVDPLVKARGGELGITSERFDKLKLTASLWALNFDSELVFVGDAGGSEPSASSKRRGVELSAFYTPVPWLVLDVDYAYAHARLDAEEGNRVPNSVEDVFGLGVTVPEVRGWSGGARLRHIGGGPLIEDNSARSKSTTVVNLQGGYRWRSRYTAKVQVLNLFDSHDNDITYFYESRLPGEPAEGVADYHFHRVEQRQVRVTLGVEF
jgi:outer membrane receptor protein involved in Fe transport